MEPYIKAKESVREFSFRAIFLGLIFGLFFAIANAYLGLKVGMTVSASIPAAILSLGILKLFFRKSTILEHNIVQTIATIGETIAGGVVFTIPALFFLGEVPSPGRIFLLSVLGGILGILFMIPMRRYLIVEEHGKLPYPEGTACAEILKASEQSSKAAIIALWGVLLSSAYKLCTSAFFFWKETASWIFQSFERTLFTITTSPALLGVGYIIGLRLSSLMFAGGIFAWWVIIPLIVQFGLGNAAIFPSDKIIGSMSSNEIWSNYVRYIGAGTIAVGGLMGLLRILPIIHKTIHVGMKELLSGFSSRKEIERTDRDISMAWLMLGSVFIILVLWLFPGLPMNFLTILLLAILGFFFSAVSSLTCGLVGSTSSPVSGITITTLLITCILFALLGWTDRIYLISAITMGCVTCITIVIAGTTSQDLKAGYLLGATPRAQQIAEIIGVFIPALILGYTIHILHSAYTLGSPLLPAPQGTMLAMIAEGVISGDLPYNLAAVGVIIGIVMALLRIPILPFALGLYLPFSISSAAMVGGLVREWVNRSSSSPLAQERGTLLAASFVGGDALTGVILAILTIIGVVQPEAPALLPDWVSLLFFLLFGALSGLLIVRPIRR
jgi:putative OPT family oligopeptide transporter